MPRGFHDNVSPKKGSQGKRHNKGGSSKREQKVSYDELKVSIPSLSLSLQEAIDNEYSFASIWQYGCDVHNVVLKKKEKSDDKRDNRRLRWLKGVLNLKAAEPYILSKFEEIARSFVEQGYKVYELSMTTAERLIVGLGEAHYLETGIKLSKTYGIPYISGSTLKGMLRAFCEESDDVREAFIKKVFGEGGDKGRRGSVSFLDAYPEDIEPSSLFELDVINPHYSSYYSRGETPGDWMNPMPIFFLVLRPDVKFKGLVIVEELFDEEMRKLEDCLKEALKESGVGGKKALGYGLFKDVELKPLSG